MIQAVKTYVKKMRMGMVEEPAAKEARQRQEGENAMADGEDEVQR